METGEFDGPHDKTQLPVSISDIFNIGDLQILQDLFSDATGVASIITLPDGTPVTRPSNFCRLCKDIIRKTEKGLANSMHSDAIIGRPNPGSPIVHPCLSGGLWDAGTSIIVGGNHIANWLIGQVRTPDQEASQMLQYADEIGANREDFMNALSEVPVMSAEQFSNIAKMLHVFAGELTSKVYQNRLFESQIAARKKAEEQITMLAYAIKSISECVCISDLDDNILFINEAFERTYGYMLDELTGKQVSTVRSENNDPEVIASIFPHTLKGGWKGELLNRRKDGSEFPVSISTSVVCNNQGESIALMGIAKDITENRKVEAALRESEIKFKSLFNGAHDAIFILDETRFLDCNLSTGKIFGVTADQIIGRSPWDFSPPEQPDGQLSREKAKIFLDEAMKGKPQRFDWVHLRLDGTPFYAEVSLNRILIKGTWFVQAIVRDVTKRKQAEDAIKEKASALERSNRLMIGRELKMIELKKEINDLLLRAGKPAKYIIHEK
jgi:PAS domain S-box-containing protein